MTVDEELDELERKPPLVPPMVVVTRPQDWAPAARAILWPELDYVAAAQSRRVVR